MNVTVSPYGFGDERWYSVGPVMVLGGRYAVEQGWLPFMHGTLFRSPPPETRDPVRVVDPTPYGIEGSIGVKVPEEGVAQYYLPFPEMRQITIAQARYENEAGWPTFDRGPDGATLRIEWPSDIDAFLAWSETAIEKRFVCLGFGIFFESAEDLLLAKLRWS